MTNTPFSGSHNPEKWMKYIQFMVEGYTLPKIAKKLNIHISIVILLETQNLERIKESGIQSTTRYRRK